eukprot:scaffold252613_cov19-Tisochrysis_lutea.AAC.2
MGNTAACTALLSSRSRATRGRVRTPQQQSLLMKRAISCRWVAMLRRTCRYCTATNDPMWT